MRPLARGFSRPQKRQGQTQEDQGDVDFKFDITEDRHLYNTEVDLKFNITEDFIFDDEHSVMSKQRALCQ